jgi:hypothetical protein
MKKTKISLGDDFRYKSSSAPVNNFKHSAGTLNTQVVKQSMTLQIRSFSIPANDGESGVISGDSSMPLFHVKSVGFQRGGFMLFRLIRILPQSWARLHWIEARL